MSGIATQHPLMRGLAMSVPTVGQYFGAFMAESDEAVKHK